MLRRMSLLSALCRGHVEHVMPFSPKEESDKAPNDREAGTVFRREVRRQAILERRNLQHALERITRGMHQRRGPEAL